MGSSLGCRFRVRSRQVFKPAAEGSGFAIIWVVLGILVVRVPQTLNPKL